MKLREISQVYSSRPQGYSVRNDEDPDESIASKQEIRDSAVKIDTGWWLNLPP